MLLRFPDDTMWRCRIQLHRPTLRLEDTHSAIDLEIDNRKREVILGQVENHPYHGLGKILDVVSYAVSYDT